jgi:hypothetical protein
MSMLMAAVGIAWTCYNCAVRHGRSTSTIVKLLLCGCFGVHFSFSLGTNLNAAKSNQQPITSDHASPTLKVRQQHSTTALA